MSQHALAYAGLIVNMGAAVVLLRYPLAIGTRARRSYFLGVSLLFAGFLLQLLDLLIP